MRGIAVVFAVALFSAGSASAQEWDEIHLTNGADQSRTMAFVAMRENRLYILEGTVPKGYPKPGLFYQSLGWVDNQGGQFQGPPPAR